MTKKQPIPFGKYLLLDRVNIGGMAEVWKAKTFGAEGFEKLVAIKRILPNIAEDEEFISMFIDEAKISVQLTHSNVAQVFDLGKIGDSYFIAMEYISGKDLRAMFDKSRKRGEPAPIPLTCYCLSKAAEGLDYAHRKRDAGGTDLNIVHRDVSPQNILCSYDGEVKVIDFGIAKAANKATKTQAGILKGKFGYMSPEQVRGLPLDRRSDVFALGVVLYEMLTGERLFVGESDFSVLEKVRAVDILPPSTYNRRIPPALEKIVLRALAKDVEDRFSYANELGDELQRFLITNDTIFSRKDLMQFMKSTFAEDVEREKTKLAEYSEIKLPPGMAALAGGAAPSPAARPLPPPAAQQQPNESTMMLAEAPGPASAPRAAPPGNPAPRTTGIRPAVTNPGVNGTRPGVPGPPVMTQGRAPAPGMPPGARATGVGPALSPTRNSVSGPNPIRTVSNPRMPAPPQPEPSPLASLVDEDFESESTQVPQNQRSQKAPVPAAVDDDDASPPTKSKLPLMLGVAGGVVALGLAGVVGLNVLGKAQGTLLLTATPSENLVIIVDGQPAGNSTPVSVELAAGDHEVSITSKGYELLKKNFTVKPKAEVDLDITLKKKGDATADAPKPEVPKAAAGATVPAMIVLETSGAEVSLDGKVVIAKDAKDATFMGTSDGAAKHVIEAKLDGYKPFSQAFDPGQPIQAKVTLEKAQ